MARVLLSYEANLRGEEKGTAPQTADSTVRDAPRSASGREAVWQREWVERIGWPRFFKMADIRFQKGQISDFN